MLLKPRAFHEIFFFFFSTAVMNFREAEFKTDLFMSSLLTLCYLSMATQG